MKCLWSHQGFIKSFRTERIIFENPCFGEAKRRYHVNNDEEGFLEYSQKVDKWYSLFRTPLETEIYLNRYFPRYFGRTFMISEISWKMSLTDAKLTRAKKFFSDARIMRTKHGYCFKFDVLRPSKILYYLLGEPLNYKLYILILRAPRDI